MSATQQQLIETFAALPPEAQRQSLNFIVFLQQTYQTSVFLENMAFILKHHSGTRV